MQQAIWRRIGPLTGVLSFALTFIGLSVHGYPDIRPTDAQLAKWLASVDVNSFKTGIYIEALGIVLLIPFAAWLYAHLRHGAGDSSWLPVAMVAAASGHVVLTLPINEIYAGLVEQGRNGLDIHAAQTIISINQHWFDMTGIVMGLFLVTAGAAMIRGGAMSPWAAWATILIGVAQVATSPFGLSSTPAALFPYAWILAVGAYYTFRPARERELVAGTPQGAVATST
jgi:cytochrome bd-type quinol oxidase subunit 2